MLMALVLVAVHQHASQVTMVSSQSGASVWMSRAKSNHYLTCLDDADKDTVPNLPDQLNPRRFLYYIYIAMVDIV